MCETCSSIIKICFSINIIIDNILAQKYKNGDDVTNPENTNLHKIGHQCVDFLDFWMIGRDCKYEAYTDNFSELNLSELYHLLEIYKLDLLEITQFPIGMFINNSHKG